MCCFSGDVQSVHGTRIFARMTGPGRQAVAYQMIFASAEDVAMILPIPVAKDSGEKAVQFIDLSEYPKFFADLRSGFPRTMLRNAPQAAAGGPFGEETLEVKQVGAFEASFVPTVKDFERLDGRFRLPMDVWKSLPQYADYGFAVFKLRKGEHEVHPMAFTFPTRHVGGLFFPTVHIHDGEVHAEEDFDHALYCQVQHTGLFAMTKWTESEKLASTFMQSHKAKGLLNPGGHVYRLRLKGKLKNEDIILGAA
jgi:hypothetical protein